MPLNITKGNMYSFVTHTWNAIKGKCEHECPYCYMLIYKLGKIRLDRSEFRTNLDEGEFIFIGSSCDMWAKGVPKEWIIEVLDYINKFKCGVLFQSKYPERFKEFKDYLPNKDRLVLGATLETDRFYPDYMGKTMSPKERAVVMTELSKEYTTMLTVEPIMQFDLNAFAEMIIACNPKWVNIGFDSKDHNLPEPSRIITMDLISKLRNSGMIVNIKKNSERVLGKEIYSRLSRENKDNPNILKKWFEVIAGMD